MAYTKANLLQDVAAAARSEKATVERVLSAFFETVVSEAMSGNKVSWPGFGSFSLVERGARTGRNPQTGESVKIGATKAMKFSASSVLKESLNSKPAKKSDGQEATTKSGAGKRATTTKAAGATKSTRQATHE